MSFSNREARLERLWTWIPANERVMVERYLENSTTGEINLSELSEDAQAYIRLYQENR